MTEKHPVNSKSRRQALAWLTFLVFIVAAMSFGAIVAFRDLPGYLGFDIDRELVGFEIVWAIIAALVIMTLLLYLGAISWLLFARFVFTRSEVEKVVYYGPTTPVERWLVNTIISEKKKNK